MSRCRHEIDDHGLRCTRAEHPETPLGHVYVSTSGVPDAHSKSSGEC